MYDTIQYGTILSYTISPGPGLRPGWSGNAGTGLGRGPGLWAQGPAYRPPLKVHFKFRYHKYN